MENNTAAATSPTSTGYQIEDLVVDVGQQRVTRAGTDIPLSHLSFELLVTLARAAPDLVSFDELTERVWPGLVVTPETISQRVKLVRDALGDDSHAPRYIGGVRGRGYRMVASVRLLTNRRRSFEAKAIADVPEPIVGEPVSSPREIAIAQPVPAAQEGLRPTAEVGPHRSIRQQIAKRLNRAIAVVFVLAVTSCCSDAERLEARPSPRQKANYREWVDPALGKWPGNAVGQSWKRGGCLGYQIRLDLVLKVSAQERRSCLWCADQADAPTRGQSICGRGFLR